MDSISLYKWRLREMGSTWPPLATFKHFPVREQSPRVRSSLNWAHLTKPFQLLSRGVGGRCCVHFCGPVTAWSIWAFFKLSNHVRQRINRYRVPVTQVIGTQRATGFYLPGLYRDICRIPGDLPSGAPSPDQSGLGGTGTEKATGSCWHSRRHLSRSIVGKQTVGNERNER